MIVQHHTPLPPARNGIADYAHRVNACLVDRVAFTCINENPFSRVPPGVEIIDPKQIDRWPEADVEPLYQVGNNKDHLEIFSRALRVPGTVVLHDLRLFYLHELMNLSQQHFAAMMWNANPIMARSRAHEVTEQRRKISTDYMCFDMVGDLLARSKRVIVHSDYARNILMRTYGPRYVDRVHVIPHFALTPDPVDHDQIREQLGIGRDACLVVTSGFATKVKRLDWVADALDELVGNGHDIFWLHAGEARREEFDLVGKIANCPNLAGRTRVTGFVSEEDLDAYLSSADIVINVRFPSVGESSGTLARALAAGRCCIVTKTAAYDSFPDNTVVKISPFDSTRLLRDAVAALIQNPEARTAFGNNARRYCDAHLSLDSYAESLLDLLSSDHAPVSDRTAILFRGGMSDRMQIGPFAPADIELRSIEKTLPNSFRAESFVVKIHEEGKMIVEAAGLDCGRADAAVDGRPGS